MDRKTLLTTLLIGGGTDAGTAIAQLQHAVSVLDETKADKTGTVALANNLTPYSADSGTTQTIPFINQGTGCGNGESIVDTGSYAQVKKKLGNTVCVNQLCADETEGTSTVAGAVTKTVANHRISFSGTATTDAFNAYVKYIDVIAGHKYLLAVSISGTPAQGGSVWQIYTGASFGDNYQIGSNKIIEAVSTGEGKIQMAIYNGTTIAVSMSEPRLIDLTLWYGSTSNIPAHLLSHPEDFGKYYSGSLAYNPGQLVNADGSVLTSIGRNLWDEEWEVGNIDATTGQNVAYSGTMRSKNYIPVVPNSPIYFYCSVTQTGSFPFFAYDAQKNYIGEFDIYAQDNATVPPNAHFIRFRSTGGYGATYRHDITISLYYPGESGYDQYYPYTVLAQIDTGSEVLIGHDGRGDYKAPDGVVHHVMSSVDLASLSYTKYTSGNNWIFYASIPDGRTGVGGGEILLISDVYTCSPTSKSGSQAIAGTDKNISWDSTNSQVLIKDLSISTVEALVSALNGKTLYYEKATPTTEQGTPFSGASADNFAIDDFGSMYWTQSAGVPQGVEIFYPYDYKAAVDTLLNMVDGDVEKLVTETELGAVADRIPEAPAEDGTYTFKATVADGVKTYAWVADA